VGAAATKSIVVGLIILMVSFLFVSLEIRYPVFMIIFLVMTAVSFSLLGFILGLWARNFEQLNFVPTLVITPLVFLGGSFYSIDMLPGAWQTVSLFNPAMYLISGFRWAFFGIAEVSIELSVFAVLAFASVFLGVIWYLFKTGYRLRS
jgi:ABC-2 type transport system permease protein